MPRKKPSDLAIERMVKRDFQRWRDNTQTVTVDTVTVDRGTPLSRNRRGLKDSLRIMDLIKPTRRRV